MMMPETSSLILLLPGFPADEDDSTCLPAQQSLIREINRLFPTLEILIVSFQYPYTGTPYAWHGNAVLPLNGRNKRRTGRIMTWLRAWKLLSRLHKEKRIIGLLSFWLGETSLTGHYFARWKGYTHFSWLLGQDARPGNKYAGWMPLKTMSLIAMSDFLRDEFKKNYGIRPAHIITHGIDAKMFTPVLSTRDIDIIGAGSLISLKQYDVFIEIIAAVRRQIPGISVLLSGEGPEKNRLQQLIDANRLGSTIRLTGQLPHDKLLRMMQRSRLLLHTSSYEGFGGVCIEALYAGAHVVSFTKPMQAWIRHWYVADNKNEMIRVVTELLNDPDLQHTRVLPYLMSDSAKEVIQLFNYKEPAIS
jgi:glycosyltransferase involved in cell wall biosynthesis